MHTSPRTRRRPALVKARSFLATLLTSPALESGCPLPPARRLADDADVSFVTMIAALRELRAQGKITTGKRRGYVVASQQVGSTEPPRKERTVPTQAASPSIRELVADRVQTDIRNGAFRPGTPLPSTKELGARYRISYRPLRDALVLLVREGVLERTLSGAFSVARLPTSGWKLRIVCITPSSDGRTVALSQHDEALFRALESLCELTSISLDTLLFYHDPVTIRERWRFKNTDVEMDYSRLEHIADESIAGFCFFIPWEIHGTYLRAIDLLVKNRKPMVIMDETSQLNMPGEELPVNLTRVITRSGSLTPGRIVARRLHSLGHRRVAFISANHNYSWSQSRLDGLSSVFVEAGETDGVVPFVAESLPDTQFHPVKRQDSETVAARYADVYRRISPELQPDFDPMYARIMCQRAEARLRLYSLLDKAIEDPTITAWVMVNDSSAVTALAYLREKDVRVPQDLSVISFDDSLEALRNNLSSYNFNATAVASAITGFVLGRKPFSDPAAEVEGYVVDRGTVGLPVDRER